MYLIRYSVCDTIRVRRNFVGPQADVCACSISQNLNLKYGDNVVDSDLCEFKMTI